MRIVAREQWAALRILLMALDANIELLEPVNGLPDLVFTANAGLICRDVAFLRDSVTRHGREKRPSTKSGFDHTALKLDHRRRE